MPVGEKTDRSIDRSFIRSFRWSKRDRVPADAQWPNRHDVGGRTFSLHSILVLVSIEFVLIIGVLADMFGLVESRSQGADPRDIFRSPTRSIVLDAEHRLRVECAAVGLRLSTGFSR